MAFIFNQYDNFIFSALRSCLIKVSSPQNCSSQRYPLGLTPYTLAQTNTCDTNVDRVGSRQGRTQKTSTSLGP